MKTIQILMASMLFLCPIRCLAQTYFTLPEIREQTSSGWHTTYFDAFGRTIPVDVDIEVFGADVAPVLKVKPSHYPLNTDLFEEGTECLDSSGITIYRNNPADFIFQAKSNEQPLTVYRSYGERVDMNALYMPEYGTICTVQQMVDRLCAILACQGIPTDDYVYDRPKDFSVRCKVRKDTGEVVEAAICLAHFWQKIRDLPILTHAGNAFVNVGWPVFVPQIVFGMRKEDEYQIAVQSVDETEVLAQDIPLCSFEQVKRNMQTLIESGHIRRVFNIRFGYVVYNDPHRAKDARSTFELDYYLVPSWVVNCIYMDSPKEELVYHGLPEDELVLDETNTPKYCTLIINAQTGEPLDRYDKSQKGKGNADFSSFISWGAVH